jgi:signal transduction histidine kinase
VKSRGSGLRPRKNAATLVFTGVAALVVLASIPSASGNAPVSLWVAVVASVVAIALGTFRIQHRAIFLALSATALTASTWASSTDGSDMARGISIAAAPIAVAFAGLSLGNWRRRPAMIVLLGATIAGPIRAFFEDPFLDPGCVGCRHSATALFGDNSMAFVLYVLGVSIIGLGLALSIRRTSSPLFILLIALIALAAIPLGGAQALIVATLACGVATTTAIVTISGNIQTRRRLLEIGAAPRTPDGLLTVLRSALGDPTLSIDFARSPVDQIERTFVTSAGTVSAAPYDGRVASEVNVAGELAARIHHRPSARIASQIDTVLSPQLQISIEEQRLSADLAAQVLELRESRSRVVRRADEERRRLERDLHDGAQQHVLALGFDLRTALTTNSDARDREILEQCLALTMHALDELRDVSHGVYPPLLSSAGLEPALRALSRRSRAPIEVGELPGRMPSSVERVAYLLVADFADRSKGSVSVIGRVQSDILDLHLQTAPVEPTKILRERIAALGGELVGEGRSWRLRVPCA